MRFANYHLQLAKETNDKEGEAIASTSVVDLKRKLDSSSSHRSESTNASKRLASIEHNLKVKDGIDYFQRKQHVSRSTSQLIEVVNESEFFNKNNLLKRNINQVNQTSPVKVFSARPISVANLDRFGKCLERAAVLNHYQTPVKSSRKRFQSRRSMENMEIMKLTPTTTTTDKTQTNDQIDNKRPSAPQHTDKLIATDNCSFLSNDEPDDNDQFLDLLASFQSKRMDDQRCSLDLLINNNNKENHLKGHKLAKSHKASLNRSVSTANSSQTVTVNHSDSSKEMKRRSSNPSFAGSSTSTLTSASITQECRDELFDLIEGIQSRRMDEQRAPLPPLRRSHTVQETHLPKNVSTSTISSTISSIDGQTDRTKLHRMSTNVEISSEQLNKHNSRQMSFSTDIQPDDDFFDQLMRCQASRLDSQRTLLPSFAEASNNNNNEEVINQNLVNNPRPPVEQPNQQARNDEDFLNLLMRFQAGRIEEQRSNLPKDEEDLINLNSSGGSNVDSSTKAVDCSTKASEKDVRGQQ